MSNRFFNNAQDLQPRTRARAGDVEANLDQVSSGFTLVQAEFDELYDRAPRVPLGETIGPLPDLATRASRALGFDAAGDPQAFVVASQAEMQAAIDAAAAVAGLVWISGNVYAPGDVVYDPVSFITFRRKTAGGGTTNPLDDPANWALAAIAAPRMVRVTAASTSATVNDEYVLEGALAQTVVLPAAPAEGDIIWVRVANGRTDNQIDLNGQKVNGDPDTSPLILDDQFASVACRYVSATYGWSI